MALGDARRWSSWVSQNRRSSASDENSGIGLWQYYTCVKDGAERPSLALANDRVSAAAAYYCRAGRRRLQTPVGPHFGAQHAPYMAELDA